MKNFMLDVIEGVLLVGMVLIALCLYFFVPLVIAAAAVLCAMVVSEGRGAVVTTIACIAVVALTLWIVHLLDKYVYSRFAAGWW